MVIEPEDLRHRVVSALQETTRGIEVTPTGPLGLCMTHANGRTDEIDLTPLWDTVSKPGASGDPELAVRTFADEIVRRTTDDGTRKMVVVIKSKDWVAQTHQTTANVADMTLVGDLHAVVAWDGPNGLDYDMGGDLPEEALMEALNNVLSRVEQLVLHGEDPFLLAAGGRFEPSLLLAGKIWDELVDRVQGDLVAAVPSQDVLLISGTGDPERYARFVQTARTPLDEGHQGLISTQILRWQSGSWVVHDDLKSYAAG